MSCLHYFVDLHVILVDFRILSELTFIMKHFKENYNDILSSTNQWAEVS